jgi:hypothetical protein
MVMRCELILAPFLQKSGYTVMLEVVDNVGSHHNRSVVEAYRKAGWLIAFLPPNMTHKLQPMDLVVNKPIKDALRRARIELALVYFDTFRLQYYQAKFEGEKLPQFDPPVPKLSDGLLACRKVHLQLFKDPQFRDNLLQSYIKVGLRKTISPGQILQPHYIKFVDNSKGTLGARKSAAHKQPKVLPAKYSDFSLGAELLNVMSRAECGGSE